MYIFIFFYANIFFDGGKIITTSENKLIVDLFIFAFEFAILFILYD